jgi:HEAT repeat protein
MMPDTNSRDSAFQDDESPLSEEEIDGYLERYNKVAAELEDLQSQAKPKIEEWLQTLVDPQQLELMRRSQDETLNSISDPNPKCRRAALYIAINQWQIKEDIAQQCEQMALSDADEEVRQAALGGLGHCFSRSKNARIGHLLARIIRDPDQPEKRRTRAYTALMSIHCCEEVPGLGLFSIRCSEDFHWGFVDQYFTGWVAK